MRHLKTHQYWKQRGAVEFFRDKMSIYYLIPLQNNKLLYSLLAQN